MRKICYNYFISRKEVPATNDSNTHDGQAAPLTINTKKFKPSKQPDRIPFCPFVLIFIS